MTLNVKYKLFINTKIVECDIVSWKFTSLKVQRPLVTWRIDLVTRANFCNTNYKRCKLLDDGLFSQHETMTGQLHLLNRF